MPKPPSDAPEYGRQAIHADESVIAARGEGQESVRQKRERKLRRRG